MRAARSALDAADRAGAGAALRDRFLALFAAGGPRRAVSGYWPARGEIDTVPLLEALAGSGHPCALPVVRGRCAALDFRRWRPGDELAAAAFGLREPLPEAPAAAPGIVVAPMLAADAAGRRLGQGGGHYDRTLRRLRARGAVTAVAVGFDFQVVAEVPAGPGDEPVDWVLTERRALRCSPPGGAG